LFFVRRESTWMTRRISVVAADDRVELALLGERGQVAAELLERLVRALRILRRDPLAAAHLLQRREQLLARERRRARAAGARSRRTRPRASSPRRGAVEHLAERVRDLRCRFSAPCIEGLPRRRSSAAGAQGVRRGARALDDRARQLLLEQREQQVLGVNLRVAGAARKLLRAATASWLLMVSFWKSM
jgi:hypothetical protein